MEQMKRSKTNYDLLHAFRHLRRAEANAGGVSMPDVKGVADLN